MSGTEVGLFVHGTLPSDVRTSVNYNTTTPLGHLGELESKQRNNRCVQQHNCGCFSMVLEYFSRTCRCSTSEGHLQ